MRHLTSLFDLTSAEVRDILNLAVKLKAQTKKGNRAPLCERKVLTQVFEKPSLRTRVSFEAGMNQLGGHSIFLNAKEAGLDGRETPEDIARVLGSYSDIIVLRTFSQELIQTFTKHAGCPIINGLSDDFHPCQALTDILTLEEVAGASAKKRIVYVGDGNNVAKSLALACGHVGASLTVASPKGYELPVDFIAKARDRFPKLKLEQSYDALDAVKGAHLIYTDVWASMGQEAEKEKRSQEFAGYQVNRELLDAAGSKVKFMHCLPARRGLEVSEEAMDDPRSVIFEQAENRMHLAKAVMVWLLEQAKKSSRVASRAAKPVKKKKRSVKK
ncbi:ornithine carbamoyltransferase [Planctomicrobium sp. SH668]|uniref:ornithine carbamoyltransferase n=1 Tax=Planctomicrobium sp. SH668 TaxID=3448126 RepID=UPI003F5B3AE1